MSDLVERLRQKDSYCKNCHNVNFCNCSNGSLLGTQFIEMELDPIKAEAADELERLERENEILRADASSSTIAALSNQD